MDFFQLDLSSFIFYNHEASWQQPLRGRAVADRRQRQKPGALSKWTWPTPGPESAVN